jgi:hypothetical protein
MANRIHGIRRGDGNVSGFFSFSLSSDSLLLLCPEKGSRYESGHDSIFRPIPWFWLTRSPGLIRLLTNCPLGNTPHFSPEDGGSIFLRNIAIQPMNYTAQQPRRPPSEVKSSFCLFRKSVPMFYSINYKSIWSWYFTPEYANCKLQHLSITGILYGIFMIFKGRKVGTFFRWMAPCRLHSLRRVEYSVTGWLRRLSSMDCGRRPVVTYFKALFLYFLRKYRKWQNNGCVSPTFLIILNTSFCIIFNSYIYIL